MNLRWFEWEHSEDTKVHQLGIKSSGRVLTQLEDVGLQLALAFNAEGSLLATGGEVERVVHAFSFPLLIMTMTRKM